MADRWVDSQVSFQEIVTQSQAIRPSSNDIILQERDRKRERETTYSVSKAILSVFLLSTLHRKRRRFGQENNKKKGEGSGLRWMAHKVIFAVLPVSQEEEEEVSKGKRRQQDIQMKEKREREWFTCESISQQPKRPKCFLPAAKLADSCERRQKAVAADSTSRIQVLCSYSASNITFPFLSQQIPAWLPVLEKRALLLPKRKWLRELKGVAKVSLKTCKRRPGEKGLR